MEQEALISAKDFCIHHNIEYAFINSLQNSGLISITTVQQDTYIHPDEMYKLEKFMRFHYDLDINIEGIETIQYLLEKVEMMQQEIRSLRNKMTF